MLIQLPNETWMEILNWLKRRDLVKKLDNLWDSQFTPIVQDWLHKYTKNVKIGKLAAKATGGLHLLTNGRWKEVQIAQVEMPENITSFERITISPNLAPAMLAFLQFMAPLFRNVCLNITGGGSANEVTTRRHQAAVRHLMQLIRDHGQIEALILDDKWLQFLADNFHDALFNARVLSCWDYELDHLLNWLFTRREDGQPRTLVFYGGDDDEDQQFCTRIRERFLDPARQPNIPCPFFIRIWASDDEQLPIPPITENVATGEQLTVREVGYDNGYWLITNSPMGADGEWLARKMAEVFDWHNGGNRQRTIMLDFPDNEDVEDLDAEDLDAEELDAEDLDAEELDAEELDAEKLDAEELDDEDLDAEDVDSEDLDDEDAEDEDYQPLADDDN